MRLPPIPIGDHRRGWLAQRRRGGIDQRLQSMTENEIGTLVIEAVIAVHRELGLELKPVERVTAAHKKQVQTCRKLTGCKLGYLVNFGEDVMETGSTRCVSGLEE